MTGRDTRADASAPGRLRRIVRTPLTNTVPAAFVMLIAAAILFPSPLRGQTAESEVRAFIAKLDKGQADAVRSALPDLISKYQNTPDILYLQGRLASDGIEAVKYYQGIVDNYPKSVWADDALYRIYQYYTSLGLYRTAELKLQQLRKEYPNSPHVTGRPAAPLPAQDEAALNLPGPDTVVERPAPAPGRAGADAAPPSSRSAAPAPGGAYTLQVGAFSTLSNAEKQRSFFQERGYAAEITNKVRNGRSLHLVWVGSFPSSTEAMKAGRDVKARYKIDSIVVERY